MDVFVSVGAGEGAARDRPRSARPLTPDPPSLSLQKAKAAEVLARQRALEVCPECLLLTARGRHWLIHPP